MPGFDGTGPVGGGPMTGWGRGVCGTRAGVGRGVGIRRGIGRGGAPWGGGLGRGFGGGRGRAFGGGRFGGFGRRFFGAGRLNPSSEPSWTPEDEAEMLRNDLSAAREEMAAMERRLQELENKED